MTVVTTSILDGTGDLFSLNSGEVLLVLPDVTLVTGLGGFFESVIRTAIGSSVSGTSVIVLGTVAVDNASAAIFLVDGGLHSVSIGTEGIVSATTIGGGYPIYMSGDFNRLDNAGQIIGGGAGVYLTGAQSDIVNSGSIIGGSAGVQVERDGSSVTNTGTITGSRGDNGAGFTGVTLSSGGDMRLFNAGTILAAGNGFSQAVYLLNARATITNSGLISSTQGIAISLTTDSAVTLFNTGTISGLGGSIVAALFDDLDDTVVNTGTLIGNVSLGEGDDLFDNLGGTVIGTVDGGAGDDVYRMDGMTIAIIEGADGGADRVESTGSYDLTALTNIENLTLLGTAETGIGNARANAVTGNAADNVLSGQEGADTLEGAGGDDALNGGDGKDRVTGGLGDDLLHGNLDSDQVYGGAGDDTLLGDDGNDVMEGGAENDLLLGGAGKDRISGLSGQDTLVGGLGPDVLTGGAGADTFRFNTEVESGPTAAQRDRIADFVSELDVIDLAGIDARRGAAGDQAFDFIGAAAFTAVGQLRYAGGILEGDVTGDGIADFRITMTGAPVLVATDLIL